MQELMEPKSKALGFASFPEDGSPLLRMASGDVCYLLSL